MCIFNSICVKTISYLSTKTIISPSKPILYKLTLFFLQNVHACHPPCPLECMDNFIFFPLDFFSFAMARQIFFLSCHPPTLKLNTHDLMCGKVKDMSKDVKI